MNEDRLDFLADLFVALRIPETTGETLEQFIHRKEMEVTRKGVQGHESDRRLEVNRM